MAEPIFTIQSAEITAQLFENPHMGVARGVYWTCGIKFAPLADPDEPDEDWPCKLYCDWITWPIRSWRDINGLSLANCVGPTQLESSLYFFGQHQALTSLELSFQHSQADCFRIKGRFVADLAELQGRSFRALTTELDVEARFTGLNVSVDNLVPKPKSAEEVLAALAKYADLEAYEAPQWSDPKWVFRPKLG